MVSGRVSCETSFDSKEPKLVSTLSETRRLFRLYIETGSFSVSIEPKQKENNRNKTEKSVNTFINFNIFFIYFQHWVDS
jgi:hypothetical protein